MECLVKQLKAKVGGDYPLFNLLSFVYQNDQSVDTKVMYNTTKGINCKCIGTVRTPYNGQTYTDTEFTVSGNHAINLNQDSTLFIYYDSNFAKGTSIIYSPQAVIINKSLGDLVKYCPKALIGLINFGNKFEGSPKLSEYIDLVFENYELVGKEIESIISTRGNVEMDVDNINYTKLGKLTNLTTLRDLPKDPDFDSIGAAMVSNERTSGTLIITSPSSKKIMFNSSYTGGYQVVDL
jgi:hypothetical protein